MPNTTWLSDTVEAASVLAGGLVNKENAPVGQSFDMISQTDMVEVIKSAIWVAMMIW